MREHRLYRLAISFLYDLAPRASSAGPDSSTAALDAGAPARDDPIVARLEQELPVEAYGRYWSEQLRAGRAAWAALPPDRFHSIRFEDLIARPQATLAEVADFFDLPPAPWIPAAVGLVRRNASSRVGALPPAERQRLQTACAPGMRLLGRAAGP